MVLGHYVPTFDLMSRSQQMTHRLKQLANDSHGNCWLYSHGNCWRTLKTLEQMLRDVGYSIRLYWSYEQ